MNKIPATGESFAQMKGQKFTPHEGEGVVYLKLVALTPDTMENGDPQAAVANAEGVILAGKLDDVKHQINKWFDEMARQYTAPKQEKY